MKSTSMIKRYVAISLFALCNASYASYTLDTYPSMPAGLERTFINDAGDLVGWKFYFDSSSGITTTMGAFDSPLFFGLNENGEALAMETWTELGASRYRSYIYNGDTRTDLQSTNGEDPFAYKIDEAGNAFGGTYRRVGSQSLGRPTIFNSNGTVEYLSFYFNGSHSEGGTYLRNSSGNVLGWSSINSNFEAKVVMWNGGTPSIVNSILGENANVGLIQTLSDGRAILGHYTGNTYEAYSIWDNGNQEVLDTGGLSVANYELDGTVIGHYLDVNNVVQNAFYHPSTGITNFSTLMAPHAPNNFQFQFFDRNSSGVFAGYTRSLNTSTIVSTLTPDAVPEPTSLAALAISTILVSCRRNKPKA